MRILVRYIESKSVQQSSFDGNEATIGRGTDQPFTRIGHPDIESDFSFTPTSRQESVYPTHEGKLCKGIDLYGVEPTDRLDLSFLIMYYNELTRQEVPYFKKYFTRLAGTTKLQQQIEAGNSEEVIRTSWQEGLTRFAKQRKPYLIYQEN